ncbi:MAG: HAMP domain-containing protein [Hyphomicrobiales bacterium]|nr:HAMP domain-containing protein [Hyphomicrobiales bacterium]
MKLLPGSLAGQLVTLLIGALIVVQVIGFVVFTGDRASAVRSASRAGLFENMASVMRVLVRSPEDARAGLADAAATPRLRYWVSETSAVAPPEDGSETMPAHPLERMLKFPLRERPRVAVIDDDGEISRKSPGDYRRRPGGRGPRHGERYDVLASIPFPDGGWLNAQTDVRAETVDFPWSSVISAVVMAVAILAIVGFTARRVTRPLAALADSAEAFGRGGPSRPLPETGPGEVRRLTAAFNRMQERLERFIADRTRMLAAIGHDLRTPITSLRLRAELLDDDEARTRMIATLDDMQAMAEAALAFTRDDAAAEPVRTVDLGALTESLCDDLSTLDHDVVFQGEERIPYACRPAALKRALGNLIENAVRYGARAQVSLESTPSGPKLIITDDGPGIPEDRMDEVFKPFVRLEASRSRETGGVGLGLAIARSIVLAHGGEIVLSNRTAGGLRVEVRLPPGASPADAA